MSTIPNLTPAELERLALLIEECGEVIQAATKVLRHGYASFHPTGNYDNRKNLERELGDLHGALMLMYRRGDVSYPNIQSHGTNKLVRVGQWLHHQD